MMFLCGGLNLLDVKEFGGVGKNDLHQVSGKEAGRPTFAQSFEHIGFDSFDTGKNELQGDVFPDGESGSLFQAEEIVSDTLLSPEKNSAGDIIEMVADETESSLVAVPVLHQIFNFLPLENDNIRGVFPGEKDAPVAPAAFTASASPTDPAFSASPAASVAPASPAGAISGDNFSGLGETLGRLVASLSKTASQSKSIESVVEKGSGNHDILLQNENSGKTPDAAPERQLPGLIQQYRDFLTLDKTSGVDNENADTALRQLSGHASMKIPERMNNEITEKAGAAPDPDNDELRDFLTAMARNSDPEESVLRAEFRQAKVQHSAQEMRHVAVEKVDGSQAIKGDNPVSTGDLNLQSGLLSGTGEKTSFAVSDPPKPDASFEKSMQTAENKIVSQVFVRLYSGVRQGSGQMTINIHPPEMGSVKVRIISDNGRLSVHLHPQNQQVAGVLDRHLPTLQQSLADLGLDVSDLQVSVDSGEQERSRFEDHVFAKSPRSKASSISEEDHESGLKPDNNQAWTPGGPGLSLRV